MDNISKSVYHQDCFNTEINQTSVIDKKTDIVITTENIQKKLFEEEILKTHQIISNTSPIIMGQGEYIVFHVSEDGTKTAPTAETFSKIYPILTKYSPGAICENTPENIKNICAQRYELIKAELQKIDSSLQAVFIPKTLYELVYLKKCIKEDITNRKICRLANSGCSNGHKLLLDPDDNDEYQKILKKQQEARKTYGCWHQCYHHHFTNESYPTADNLHPELPHTAYRLNKVMVKKFNPSAAGFSLPELSVFADKEIEFFKTFSEKEVVFCTRGQDLPQGNGLYFTMTPDMRGPTLWFNQSASNKNNCLAISDDSDAKIVKNALLLDCSAVAQRSILLYRGSELAVDNVCTQDGHPYSLSYGTGLFAGAVYDPGATAFKYMREKKLDASVISVPFEEVKNSPFRGYLTHTLDQLGGELEVFHFRTKAWKGCDPQQMKGMSGPGGADARAQIYSEIDKETLVASFADYKSKAMSIK